MNTATTNPDEPVLVDPATAARLRQEEQVIVQLGHSVLSAGTRAAGPHLVAYSFAQVLFDLHDVAAERLERQGVTHNARYHAEMRDRAEQLKLWHLLALDELIVGKQSAA